MVFTVTATRYRCSGCHRGYSTRAYADRHEAACNKMPGNCGSCKDWNLGSDTEYHGSYSHCTPGEDAFCDSSEMSDEFIDKNMIDGVFNAPAPCPYWKPKFYWHTAEEDGPDPDSIIHHTE